MSRAQKGELIFKSMAAPIRRSFVLSTSVRQLNEITGRTLPAPGEVFKFISLHGGVASLSFIKWVAERGAIDYLQASTLRIGPKQYQYLDAMAKAGRIKAARFVVSSMQDTFDGVTARKHGRNYAREFQTIAARHGWEVAVVNNHSKLILMQTNFGSFVLETSSNLNENPKIEQYSFEDNAELHEFYTRFFDALFDKAVQEK